MSRIIRAILWVWDQLPTLLLAAAVGFVAGICIQGSYLEAAHQAELQALRSQHLQSALELAERRAEERRSFIERLNKQVEESNEKHKQDAAKYAGLQRTLDRMRDEQATAELYLRATAESAAARAATAEKLFGDCRREYIEMARRAGLHALDLRDALVH